MNKETLKGLTETQVASSIERYGKNVLPAHKPKSFLKTAWENLCDPIIRILLMALVVNVLFTYKNVNWAECGGILLSILIATLVSTLSERGGEKAFAKMSEMEGDAVVTVLRPDTPTFIDASCLAVGDLVYLSAGEKIPADGKVVSGEMKVDQSALNGESKAVKKHPAIGGDGSPSDAGMLFSGSMIHSGCGYMRVTAVGENTLYGKIALELQEQGGDSPMKERLTRLARTISRIGYVAAALVSLTYLVNAFFLSGGSFFVKIRDFSFVGSTLLRAITTAITVIVVAVPEGLPMMLTVVLCANMKKMYKNGVMVKKPVGIETAGSMNVLFCDKTGTLTTGNLSVNALYLGNLCKISTPGALRREKEILRHLALQAYCNSEAILEKGRAVGGNATERALLSFVGKCSVSHKTMHRLPFDSRYKFSSATLYDLPMTLYKGAPEVLLPKCTGYLSQNGVTVPLADKGAIKRKITEIEKSLGRVILLCYGENPPNGEAPPENLTLTGILSLRDEIRPTAQKSLLQMEKAGVQTVMVTGDSRETAAAIASRLGFSLNGRYAVMTSRELAELSDGEVKKILPSLRVLARALPSDKSRLVRLCREMGLVVGMTGDGVNDAPALKAADVGFAMGSGTEVAKAASDIVITDCDFHSITVAVLYGRTIFKSLGKFIVFQLTMNLCAVGVSLFGQFVGIETPITVTQMLWVNIIMDTLGGLAFAGEAPLARYMTEKPKKRNEPILRGSMIKKTLVMGCYTVFLCTLFLFSPRVRAFYADENKLLCAFFALFIFSGIAICFTARSEGRRLFCALSQNRTFLVIMIAIFVTQMAMLYLGGATFRCTPLTVRELGLAMLFSLTIFPVDFLRRLFCLFAKR